MVDYAYVASYDVRNVILNELQNNGLLDLSTYMADGFNKPMAPLIPAQQVPEFNNLLPGKTYIIYDVVERGFGVQYWISEETLTLDITSRDPVEIRTMINFLLDFFRRYDKSADEFNIKKPAVSPYTYHYFKVDSADPVQAFHDEGGFMNGMISITYTYTRELDSTTGKYL